MNRTRLKNNFLKKITEENEINCKKQRNYCMSLIRKEKRRFFSNLHTKYHLISKKQNITLLLDNKVICDKQNLVDSFNEYFSNLVEGLGINNDFSYLSETKHISGPPLEAICRYQNHPSILQLKENTQLNETVDSELIAMVILENLTPLSLAH